MTAREKAGKYFLEGYNCSQSVFCTFCDRFGIDEEAGKKIAAGLGGGVGRMREVCGAVSGAAMALGSICAATDGSDNESKMKNYELVREFSEKFTARHTTVICRDLLSLGVKMENIAKPDDRTAEYYKKRPCLLLVEDAAEIVEEMIKKYG
ncbi:MAG: C_GCAxxG_C_C family protein [Clostridia bacterium]|nr:C_GCAxxG_C_C family protein [Clostridia bacterium]